MAEKATAANVQADMAPPNYRAAVVRIRTVKRKKDQLSSINGEIADIYAKVEGHKVNRKAAKIFYAFDNMTPEERADVWRSLNGLCDAAGWDDDTEDLVDKAEGNVVPMRLGGRPSIEDPDHELDEALADEATGLVDDIDEALGADGFTEATEAELAAQAGRGAAEKPAAGAKKKKASEPSEPYTGDNSDLADEGDV